MYQFFEERLTLGFYSILQHYRIDFCLQFSFLQSVLVLRENQFKVVKFSDHVEISQRLKCDAYV